MKSETFQERFGRLISNLNIDQYKRFAEMINNCKTTLREAINNRKVKKRNIYEEVKITWITRKKSGYLDKCELRLPDHGMGFKLRSHGSVKPVAYGPSGFYHAKSNQVQAVKDKYHLESYTNVRRSKFSKTTLFADIKTKAKKIVEREIEEEKR